MEGRKDYTESELKEKEKLEKDIKAIFNKDYIPYFLVKKANPIIKLIISMAINHCIIS